MTATNPVTRFRFVLTVVAAIGFWLAVQPDVAAVKVNINFDKAFDFTQARTWSWNPNGAGQVIAGRTKDDDPESIRKLVEPIIFDEVGKQLPRRGLKPAESTPDLTMTYYLLLTVGSSSQTLGQFLPSTAQWGLPPFAPSTTSLEMIEQGSLVIDMSANDKLVWRGVGESKIKVEFDRQKRANLLREGVRDLLGRFPPKS
jgi:hypothetical protein